MADLLAFLTDISSESPCGDYLEYDPAYLELSKNIEVKEEDPITGEKAQPTNWRDVQKQSLGLLQRSKDLQVVLYLIRALIHLEGTSGFRDGLQLLVSLLDKYWDPIHPVLDPDDNLDPTARVNIIEELSHFDTALRPLSLVPLVDSKSLGRFSLRDVQIATDKIELPAGTPKIDVNLIKSAFQDVATDMLKENYQTLLEAVSLLQQLETLLTTKVGIGNGPNLSATRSLLKEMEHVFTQFAPAGFLDEELQFGAIADDENQRQETPAAKAPRPQAGVGAINSRQDVLKTLDLLCKYYAENEPSSPVPIFLLRAKHLVTSDFMEIVQNLLPDSVSQLALFKGPDSDSK